MIEAKKQIEEIKIDREKQIKDAPNIKAIPFIKKLFANPSHIIPEMLQNADDAGANKFRIVLKKDKIIFQNNGEKFTKDQIDKLCSIGLSTKTKLGFIGMFGIGFKSVFAISQCPEVYSGDYSFKFDESNMIVPEWIEETNETNDWDTTIVLPLKSKEAHEAVDNQIDDFETRGVKTLLFLRNVKEIEVYKVSTSNVYLKEQIDSSGKFKLFYLKKNNERKGHVMTFRKEGVEIPKNLVEHLKDERNLLELDVNKTYTANVDICLEVDEKNRISYHEKGYLYAFLPTKIKTYFPFDVNADFILGPTRQELNKPDDPYNLWLFQLVIDAMEEIIDIYKIENKSDVRADIYRLIPRGREEREDYLNYYLRTPILDIFKTREYFLTSNGREEWTSHEKVVDCDDVFFELFPDSEEVLRLLEKGEKYYISREIDGTIRKFLADIFEIQYITVNEAITLLGLRNLVDGKPKEWQRALFLYLGREYEKIGYWKKETYLERLKDCFLIPVSDGVVKLSTIKKPVFRSPSGIPDEMKEDVEILNPEMKEIIEEGKEDNEELKEEKRLIREFLWGLIPDVSPKTIMDRIINPAFENLHILETEKEDLKFNAYINYVRKNWGRGTKDARVKLKIKDSNIYEEPSKLYLSNEYLAIESGILYDIESLMKEMAGAKFVSAHYLELGQENSIEKYDNIKDWREFLDEIGVKLCPSLSEKTDIYGRGKQDFIKNLQKAGIYVEGQLEGEGFEYTGRSWGQPYSIMRNKAYLLKDFDFSSEFKEILKTKIDHQDTSFFKNFLAIIDYNWHGKYKLGLKLSYFYTTYLGRQEVRKANLFGSYSSFARWLQGSEWLPVFPQVSGKTLLAKPNNVYILSPDTMGMEKALYINPDHIRNQNLRTFLGLRTKRPMKEKPKDTENLEDIMAKYKNIAQPGIRPSLEDKKLIRRLYLKLNQVLSYVGIEEAKSIWDNFLEKCEYFLTQAGIWRKKNQIRYYLRNPFILDKLTQDVLSEVLYMPNIELNKIGNLIKSMEIVDLLKVSQIEIEENVGSESMKTDRFSHLAALLYCYFRDGNEKTDSNLYKKCKEIAELECNKCETLTFTYQKNGTKIIEPIRGDAVLENNCFWFTGNLEDCAPELADGLSPRFNEKSNEVADLIEKLFGRKLGYITKYLERRGKKLDLIFPVPTHTKGSQRGIRELDGTEKEEIEKSNYEIIIELERKDGWEPEDVHKENRGYDIISRKGNEVKYIEAKGSSDVKLTDNEHEKAELYKDKYWEYVIEREEGAPKYCFKIQDPARYTVQEIQQVVDVRWKISDWRSIAQKVIIPKEIVDNI